MTNDKQDRLLEWARGILFPNVSVEDVARKFCEFQRSRERSGLSPSSLRFYERGLGGITRASRNMIADLCLFYYDTNRAKNPQDSAHFTMDTLCPGLTDGGQP